VRRFYFIGIVFLLCGLFVEAARAQTQTFQLTDGRTLSGDIVSCNESGLVVREGDTYSSRVPWTKFSQADLKELAKNPKIAPFVQPFIEEQPEEKPRKPEITIKEVPRLARPAPNSFFGAMLSSGVGMSLLLLLYAANIYAAYEVSIFRAQPAVLVCGVSALLPVLGQIIFLSMPTRIPKVEEEYQATAEAATYSVPTGEAPAEGSQSPGSSARLAQGRDTTGNIPAAQVFQRGAFTFNRRFIETKFSGFFTIVRREAEKDLVLVIKAARGTFAAQRITRITGNEFYVQVQKGAASEEVMIPFAEIQEIQVKHKNA
jgi:hypothetical protein